MAYLDVSPMALALRTAPDEFELSKEWLRHIPSRHHFKFDDKGRVQLRARCNCSRLAVNPKQEPELYSAYQVWRNDYWRPIEINREFASHFGPRPALLRFLIDVTAALHRRLLRIGHAHDEEEAMVPAE